LLIGNLTNNLLSYVLTKNHTAKMKKPQDSSRITSYVISPKPDDMDDIAKPDPEMINIFEYCVNQCDV